MVVKVAKALAASKDISVKTMLHTRIPGMSPARDHAIIHASDLTREKREFCPREFALMDIAKKKGKDEFIGTSLQVTYDLGWALQDMLSNKWMPDALVGSWECSSCGKVVHDCTKPKVNCAIPSVKCNWHYEEARFKDEESGLSCGIDGLVQVGEPKLRPLEIKTMDKDMFRDLKAPLAEHRLRTNLYLRLIASEKRDFAKTINTNVAHVLYIIKGFGFKDVEITKKKGVKDAAFSPFKEFLVKRDDSQTDHLIAKAKAVTQFRNGGGIPCGLCKTSFEKRAKICPVIKECFSGQFPAQVNWENL